MLVTLRDQGAGRFSYLDLCAIFHFAFLWDGICDYNSFQITFLNSPQSRTREDSMCQYSINFGSTSISQSGGITKGTGERLRNPPT